MESSYPVRLSFRSDTPVQLLSRPTGALLTVSADAEKTLNDLGIISIFDLGASLLFSTAQRIVAAASPNSTEVLDRVAADYFDISYRGKSLQYLADAPLEALRQIGASTSKAIETALGVTTVRELSVWPAFSIARQIINDAYGLTPSIVDDPERPDDLIPISRRYATERVTYDVIIMDKVLGDEKPRPATSHVTPATNTNTNRNPLDIVTAGGIDVSDVVRAALVAKPAVGAVLTYRQSWFPQGLALGHLLHSMALAPGESTRIAMVDWTRSVRAKSADDTTQAEALMADIARTRAISEVTSSVAKEAQNGFSESSSAASQYQTGQTLGSAGISVQSPGIIGNLKNAFLGGELGSVGVSSSGSSAASASNAGWASSKSGSTGERSLNSQMSQNITDRTQQASNSVRNRRATTVMESSQKESENLSTRVVTNYNHMHALTIQYFEVVQIYRMVVELSRVTPCLFVPMKLVTFTEQVLRRYRSVIARAGLIPEVQALAFAQNNQLAVEIPGRVDRWVQRYLGELKLALGDDVATPTSAVALLPMAGLQFRTVGSWNKKVFDNFDGIAVLTRQGSKYVLPFEDGSEGANNAWLPSYRATLGSLHPADIAALSLKRKAASQTFEDDIEVAIGFDFKKPDGTFASYRIDTLGFALAGSVHAKAGEAETPIFAFQPSIAEADLLQHLEENALYYSTAIWQSLDAATITTLLASYTLGGQRLIENLDPVPVAVSGNYILFRYYGNVESDAWKEFLKRHDLENPVPSEDLVPLPSGGVFAEAVLGRSNSAEKLDITRFWNWQDSPIPILPPEINPLTAGGKANDPIPKTSGLEGTVLNIVAPPSLPDPAGLAPLYNAITNGNMFRDMSGLAQTAALAQAALQAVQSGTGQATTAAGQAQQVAAKQLTDLLQLAAQVALAAGTGGTSLVAGAALNSTAGGISGQGAKINQGRNMDSRGVPLPDSRAPEAGSGLASQSSGSAAESAPASVKPNASRGSYEAAAFSGNFGGSARNPLGVLQQMFTAAAPAPTVAHTYSKSLVATKKQAIDSRIWADYRILADYKNELYLKKLIEIGSQNKRSVSTGGAELQFFIIRGGAEGFLGPRMENTDGSKSKGEAPYTDTTFDYTELLAVFDGKGDFVSSALLERPLIIPRLWSEETANKVFSAWDQKAVFIYKNENFSIPYLGIGVNDGFRSKGTVVDMHKKEQTNGCIFIINDAINDPKTPAWNDSAINDFEPELILKVLGSVGKKPADVKGSKISLGTIYMVDLMNP